jgi:hypothetical protein
MKHSVLVLAYFALAISASALSGDKAAYEIAKGAVQAPQQKKVLSFFGRGSSKEIKTWFIKFPDGEKLSSAQVVVVENGKIERQNVGDAPSSELRLGFDPASCKVPVETALQTASEYARQSVIPYDSTRVYLNRFGAGKPAVWTVEMIYEGRSQGFIYADAKDGRFAGYRPPPSGDQNVKGSPTSSGKAFMKEVEDTFVDVGADLEEFFTGERTIDKPDKE